MGNKKYVYKSKFQVGSNVRVAPGEYLEKFMRTWRYHHKLSPEQIQYAGQSAVVERVSFYHGGDVLYDLVGIPGTWHEQCLFSDADEIK
jgi:hypothetical protein